MRIISVLIAVLMSLPAWASWDCQEEYSSVLEAKEAVGAAQVLSLEVAAGSLKVTGDSGLSHVIVEAEACASSQEMLEQIRIVTNVQGDRISVVAEMPEYGNSWRNKTAYLNMVVRLPQELGVVIADGSGSIDLSNVASAEIDDNSGSVDVRRISGPVSIEDGSGSITVREISGDVVIDDGSGSINVRHVQGSVLIEEDGSGSIEIRDVQNSVVIEDDGSGGIRVAKIGGDFTVAHDGSGGIDYRDVSGAVSVPSKGDRWK